MVYIVLPMSERNWSESLSRHRRPLWTAGILVALASAGVTVEEIRRHRQNPELPPTFSLHQYEKRLQLFRDPDHGDLMSIVAGTVFAETAVYTREKDPAHAAITKGTISQLIRENKLRTFDDQQLDTVIERLVESRMLTKVENPRYTSGEDDDWAYITSGFVQEGGRIKPEIAPLFYDTVRRLNPVEQN